MTDAELTRAVAERLYGAENVAIRDMCDGTSQALCRWVGGDASRDDDDFWDPIPDFATDLNAAWGLLGKMPLRRTIRDDGDGIECRLEILPESGGTVSIVWVDECGRFIETAALGESPARALCLAFLAATEDR